ncbi:hypothetical protein [Pontibacter korlensis]|uniref:hypothetical protein n=1 Tax=Pontibacter korlensis TaxID=400092 RepID=UPI001F2F2FD3|nr:hypothetical protein [Pontibacter korlensis]
MLKIKYNYENHLYALAPASTSGNWIYTCLCALFYGFTRFGTAGKKEEAGSENNEAAPGTVWGYTSES